MIQAPWIGNPDYDRNFKREKEIREELLANINMQLEDLIMQLDELMEELDITNRAIAKLEKELEELEEDGI